ncbi:hypothetical protein JCM19275_23 [Nonlabens ulvanivorans]|uniref:Calcineurin-like phosphoesterase domain-containing protein n=1 Tax=Nonlabens ulvanivorans TaxID=906888 RepID=A0A090X431_NONUL|nr:hypothetical protein JCM19275_23 [Nonlabens ulvanivorans]
MQFPEHNRFKCEGMDVWITHIGGYPGRYNQRVRPEIYNNPPDLFICGHSHILKVINDKKIIVYISIPELSAYMDFIRNAPCCGLKLMRERFQI